MKTLTPCIRDAMARMNNRSMRIADYQSLHPKTRRWLEDRGLVKLGRIFATLTERGRKVWDAAKLVNFWVKVS